MNVQKMGGGEVPKNLNFPFSIPSPQMGEHFSRLLMKLISHLDHQKVHNAKTVSSKEITRSV